MIRHRLTDEQWNAIADLFPQPKVTGRPPRKPREMFDAILWILRTGSPWRDLPSAFGPWGTAWDTFDRWNADGTLDAALDRLRSAEIDAENLDDLWCVDGTVVRAARCAAGGGKKGIRRNRKTTRLAALAAG
jgi:transposase